jgi:signal transduction histidine kinase
MGDLVLKLPMDADGKMAHTAAGHATVDSLEAEGEGRVGSVPRKSQAGEQETGGRLQAIAPNGSIEFPIMADSALLSPTKSGSGRTADQKADQGADQGADPVTNQSANQESDRASGVARSTTRWRWGIAVLFVLAFVLADSATELFPHPRFGVQPWNLRPALAIALLAGAGPKYVPLVLLALLCAWAIVAGTHLGAAWFFAGIGLAASYWGSAIALRRWSQWGGHAVGPRDVNCLLVISLATAAITAAIDALRQIAAPEMDASAYPLLTWRLFIADLLGIVVWLPAMLQFLGGAWDLRILGARAPVLARDAILLLFVLAAILVLVFGFQPLDDFRMSYLLFLPMIVAAMRYGLPGVVVTLPVVQLGLLGALATVGIRPGTAFEFQLLIVTLAISSLYLGALTDERRRAAEQIALKERALRERSHALDEAQRIASTAELAAALAHDLSQPLSAIGTYARASQLLAERGDDQRPKLVEVLRLIVEETTRAGQYLRRMREFFRTGTMHTDRIVVTSLLESTHAHLRDRLIREGVSWDTTIEPGLPTVRADAVQTGAILGNLVANACDAMAQGGTLRQVHLTARRAPGSHGTLVQILVQDTGPGVRPELRERLFKPLATSKLNGMGLGLALSRSIAERQGGRLWFEPDGERTTFCLELPCHA